MRKLATLCLTLAVVLGSVGVSESADYQNGLTAYGSGDYATALREWTPLAEQGDASAQYKLGWMYDNGIGVSQDYKTAVKWYRLAAKQGDAFAQYLLYELQQKLNPTRYYYRLMTKFSGPGMCLDVINGGARNNTTHLVTCGDYSGQKWRFISADRGFYRLTTRFRGAQMCLDVYDDGPRKNEVYLTPCADYSGQFWRVQQNHKWYRLTNSFLGTQSCLTIAGSPHLMPCTNSLRQLWLLQRTPETVPRDTQREEGLSLWDVQSDR